MRAHSICKAINPSLNEKAIAICLLINLDWIQPLSKSLTHSAPRFTVKSETWQSTYLQRNQGMNSSHSSQQTSSAHTELNECLMQRFYCMIFEHFIQISVMLEALAESIVSILESTTGFTTRSHDGSLLRASYESHTEAHDHINRAFTDFQMAFRDLCIPKLTRPVWPTLTLASLAEQDELNSSESYPETMPGVRSWVNQLPSFGIDMTDSGPTVNVAENLTQSFVRGCLCLQISKAVARDRGFFLGQVLTGLLMHYQGWIPTVQPKEQGPFSFQRNTCEAFARKDAEKFQPMTADSSRLPLNFLLEQLLTQFGCTLSHHDCDSASILNGTGNVFSTTVIHGQQRDRLLALLYICTYFLRAPALLHSREQLPDLGRADLFELEQQRRRIRHGSKGRRKSGSLLSSTGAAGSGTNVNRGYASSDPHDSGISSQEDLTAAVYSASAGSSPSHPSGMALCLTHKLTQDQCRLAEAAAHYVVNREAAAAAQLGAANRQTGFCPTIYGVPDVSVLSFASSTIPKGHTWTASGHGRLSSVAGILASEAVFGTPVANASMSIPSNNNSMRGPQLTEIPLLIERSFDDTREVCWCLGPRASPLSSPGPAPSPSTVLACPTTTGPVLSASSSATNRRSPNKNNPAICSVSVGVPVAQAASAARPSDTPPRTQFSSHFISSGNSQSTSPSYASPPDLNPSEIGQPALSLDMELGTACYVGMEEPKSSDFDHAFHCQVALGVMDRYTSGLALQATVESQDTFRQRLQNEMLDWLRYAPTLARRAVCTSTLTGGVGVSSGVNLLKARDNAVHFPSASSSPSLKPLHSRANQSPVPSTATGTTASAITDLTCSALIVNVDTSTVEVHTIGRRCDRPIDSSCNHQLSLHHTTSQNRSRRGDVAGAARLLPRPSEQQTTFVCDSGSRSSRLATASTPTSAWGHRTSIVSEKSLSSTVKLLSERAGCPALALRHLEAGLQLFHTRSRILTDLILTEGINVLSQLDRTAAVVGCPRGDLPLLLSISRSQSCSVAALLQINQVDFHDFR
ncbi:hypothetical protein AAHC03_01628 [Spirometra sp. Aus1]